MRSDLFVHSIVHWLSYTCVYDLPMCGSEQFHYCWLGFEVLVALLIQLALIDFTSNPTGMQRTVASQMHHLKSIVFACNCTDRQHGAKKFDSDFV